MRGAARETKALLAAACILVTSLWLLAFGAVDAASPVTGGLVDAATGQTTYTVGPGVTELLVKLVGGAGGSSVDDFSGFTYSTPGGAAGTVAGVLAVTPGEVLYLEVGANGANSSGTASVGAGGAGGATFVPSTGYSGITVSGGAGGGGATTIQTCPTATCNPALFGTSSDPRLVVAGGGGGAGDLNSGDGGSGGSGGHPAYPGVGGGAAVGSPAGGAGGGGTSTTGGHGGAGGPGFNGTDDGSPGTAGSATAGGAGGAGASVGGAGGGGGGGGYFAGGGGGGAGNANGGPGGLGYGGGGGGGESYAGTAMSDVSFGREASATPEISISYPSVTALSAMPAGHVIAGSKVALSATVSSVDGGTPTGTVAISDGAGASCTAMLAGGHGSCALTLPTAGDVQFTGVYSGDQNYAGSTGQLAYTVSASTPASPPPVPVPDTGALQGAGGLPALALIFLGCALGLTGVSMRGRRRAA